MSWSMRLTISYSPVYEFLVSLHTYICRKSHKKIDLSVSWAAELQKKLTPELEHNLQQIKIDDEWKSTFLLVHLSPQRNSLPQFLAWLEQMSGAALKHLFAEYSHPFPADIDDFLTRTVRAFKGWYEQYYQFVDPSIDEALIHEAAARTSALDVMPAELLMDETTNGLVFGAVTEASRLLLVPQYHFQPLNIIYQFDDLIVCHYNARIYLGDDTLIPTPDLRLIRSLGERSRLKILRYLESGPRTFIEIVRHLKLSKGITHDHVSNLRKAGLLYAHFEGETLVEYSIRKKALYQVQDKLLSYIEQTEATSCSTNH
ncbi:ArsR family transcriptional regulator [Paenibacillus sp. GCM10027627]|uniref:ArsR family transcriptional regulator n=1 Tax=unclassified Paenibacillus TaxID=185978 RepID=UPI00362724FB